ncbi:transposase [Bacillus thuringiensis]|nr:transposase [Bacillus thuringiensis]
MGRFLHLNIRNSKEHDALYAATLNSTVQPKDLLFRDLGYFSLDELQSIHQLGGYFISMIKHNVKIYLTKEKSEHPKCAEDFIKDLKPGETIELNYVYINQKRILQPRLILYRLTEKQELGREEKWKKRQKRMKHTSKHRQTHPIYAYITNTSVEDVARKAVYPLYSLRWQIEILFKIWKSIFRINRVKNEKRTIRLSFIWDVDFYSNFIKYYFQNVGNPLSNIKPCILLKKQYYRFSFIYLNRMRKLCPFLTGYMISLEKIGKSQKNSRKVVHLIS